MRRRPFTILSLLLCVASVPVWVASPHRFATPGWGEPPSRGRVGVCAGWTEESTFVRVYVPLRRPEVGPPGWVVVVTPATATKNGGLGWVQPNPAFIAWKARQLGPHWSRWGFGLFGGPEIEASGNYRDPEIASVPSADFPGRFEFRVIRETFPVHTLIGRGYIAWVPNWLPAAATAVLPAIWYASFVGQMLRRLCRPPWECVACGYDLRATPARCPECGAAAAAQ